MIFETLIAVGALILIAYFGYKYYKKAKTSGSTGLGGSKGRDGSNKF